MKGDAKKRELELRQVIAEEGSRGRLRPVNAVSLERQRRIRVAAKFLENPGCDRETYIELIRDDFGLPDGSPEYLLFLKVWDESH
jgi:hypothetical protein